MLCIESNKAFEVKSRY